jgi:type IV pilus assembly protein PilE
MKVIAGRKGFTLIELMIVIVIVAILVALALPSYSAYVRKARRGDAEKALMNWANVQEIWRANNPTYADDVEIPPPPNNDYYNFSLGDGDLAPSASAYILIATPKNDQAKDKERGKSCGAESGNPLSLNQSGTKGPQYDGVTYCWGD